LAGSQPSPPPTSCSPPVSACPSAAPSRTSRSDCRMRCAAARARSHSWPRRRRASRSAWIPHTSWRSGRQDHKTS